MLKVVGPVRFYDSAIKKFIEDDKAVSKPKNLKRRDIVHVKDEDDMWSIATFLSYQDTKSENKMVWVIEDGKDYPEYYTDWVKIRKFELDCGNYLVGD